jgi:hypothetical protein
MLEAVISLETFLSVEWHYCKSIAIFSPSSLTPIQPLRTGRIFSSILKIIQINLLAKHFKVSEKSSVIYHTFIRSDIICFTPGFPVKGPKLGVLSTFTHVVAPSFEVLSLSVELVSLSLYFFLASQFLFV